MKVEEYAIPLALVGILAYMIYKAQAAPPVPGKAVEIGGLIVE